MTLLEDKLLSRFSKEHFSIQSVSPRILETVLLSKIQVIKRVCHLNIN